MCAIFSPSHHVHSLCVTHTLLLGCEGGKQCQPKIEDHKAKFLVIRSKMFMTNNKLLFQTVARGQDFSSRFAGHKIRTHMTLHIPNPRITVANIGSLSLSVAAHLTINKARVFFTSYKVPSKQS